MLSIIYVEHINLNRLHRKNLILFKFGCATQLNSVAQN